MINLDSNQNNFDIEGGIARRRAVKFVLAHDDGIATSSYRDADIILVGLSRTGKTLVSLQLALAYGIRAANYPLITEDLNRIEFPEYLTPFKTKLFGFTIRPDYLYSVLKISGCNTTVQECVRQVKAAERLLQSNRITLFDITDVPLENIASTIIEQTGLEKRFTYTPDAIITSNYHHKGQGK